MLPSSDQVVDALRPVQDPELHRSIAHRDTRRRTVGTLPGRSWMRFTVA